jgi:hypothetical protein
LEANTFFVISIIPFFVLLSGTTCGMEAMLTRLLR